MKAPQGSNSNLQTLAYIHKGIFLCLLEGICQYKSNKKKNIHLRGAVPPHDTLDNNTT